MKIVDKLHVLAYYVVMDTPLMAVGIRDDTLMVVDPTRVRGSVVILDPEGGLDFWRDTPMRVLHKLKYGEAKPCCSKCQQETQPMMENLNSDLKTLFIPLCKTCLG